MSSFVWPSEAGSGGGVTSLNSETGAINLVAGTNITIIPLGQIITIDAASPTSGNLTDVGTDGITITGGTGAVLGAGTTIAQQKADATHNGYLSQTDWSTFNGKQAALTIGDITDAGTDGIVITGGTGAIIGTGVAIAQHVADSTHNGYLSQTDWSTFNSKGSGSVTTVSVATANGFAGSVANPTSTPAITISTTVSGIVKGNGTAVSAAVANTDYLPATTGSAIQKADGSGGLTAASAGTDYQAVISTSTAVSNQFVTGFTAPNTFTRAQPSFTNISGVATVAQVVIATATIASTSIDWSLSNAFKQTLSASRTFTFSNVSDGQTIVVRLTNTASNYTVTWPTVRWAGGTPPVMTVGAFSDVYTFFYDGANIYGSVVQNMS